MDLEEWGRQCRRWIGDCESGGKVDPIFIEVPMKCKKDLN